MPRGLTRSLERAATRTVGVQSSVTGLTRRTFGGNGVYRTLFTFNAMPITVTDALAYASQKIFDFPLGRINIKGGRASLAFAVTSARASPSMTAHRDGLVCRHCGGIATTLATTMQSISLRSRITRSTARWLLTRRHQLPMSPRPRPMTALVRRRTPILNVSFPTGTDIDGDGTLAVNGTIELHWENWGALAPAA
jgi:hypothetical protein